MITRKVYCCGEKENCLVVYTNFYFLFRCEGQSIDNSAPLATNDSDDDISDEETAGVKCEEVFSR